MAWRAFLMSLQPRAQTPLPEAGAAPSKPYRPPSPQHSRRTEVWFGRALVPLSKHTGSYLVGVMTGEHRSLHRRLLLHPPLPAMRRVLLLGVLHATRRDHCEPVRRRSSDLRCGACVLHRRQTTLAGSRGQDGHPLAAGCHENGIGQGTGARSPARRLRYKNGAAKAPIPIAGGPAPSRPRRDPAEMGVRANPPLLSRKGGEAGLPPMKGRARRAGTAAIVRGRQLSSIAAAAKTMRAPKAGATSQRASYTLPAISYS